MLQDQNTWLNTELKAKTDELLTHAREKGNEILELKCNLENKKDEVKQQIGFHVQQINNNNVSKLLFSCLEAPVHKKYLIKVIVSLVNSISCLVSR